MATDVSQCNVFISYLYSRTSLKWSQPRGGLYTQVWDLEKWSYLSMLSTERWSNCLLARCSVVQCPASGVWASWTCRVDHLYNEATFHGPRSPTVSPTVVNVFDRNCAGIGRETCQNLSVKVS